MDDFFWRESFLGLYDLDFIALHAGIGLVCLLLKTVLQDCDITFKESPFTFFCCPSFTPCKITKTMKACLGTKKTYLISYWKLGL